jgi:hypothetical protein
MAKAVPLRGRDLLASLQRSAEAANNSLYLTTSASSEGPSLPVLRAVSLLPGAIAWAQALGGGATCPNFPVVLTTRRS